MKNPIKTANRIKVAIEKMKARVVEMKYDARDAGLASLANELQSVHMLMDEAVGQADSSIEEYSKT